MNTQLLKLYTAAGMFFGVMYVTVTTEIPEPLPPLEKIYVQASYIEVEPLVDPNEVECLALNVYHEARGEGKIGKLAVAHVTLNRVQHTRFPNRVCDVVYRPNAFSWTLNKELRNRKPAFKNKIDENSWQHSIDLAKRALLGRTNDPTVGATHYYNPQKADPYWKNSFELAAVVGNHTFLR